MTAGSLDLTEDLVIEAGSTFDLLVPLKDDAGTGLSLGAYSGIRMKLRTSIDETTAALVSLDTQTGLVAPGTPDDDADLGTSGMVIDSGGTAGVIRITISPADTTILSDLGGDEVRTGVYDVEVYDTGTPVIVWRVLEGSWAVSPESTR